MLIFVSDASEPVHSATTHVIWAQNQGVTALTYTADFSTDATTFGVLMPIPSAPMEWAPDGSSPQTDLVARLDEQTAARFRRYSCDDVAGGGQRSGRGLSCWGNRLLVDDYPEPGEVLADGFVTPVRHAWATDFVSGESLTGQAELTSWLIRHGFSGPPDPQGVLANYLADGGTLFATVVEVDPTAPKPGWLEPLSIELADASPTLPIRLAASAAVGRQELVLYGLTPWEDGALAIAAFEEVSIEDGCMWPEGESFDAYYARSVDEAFADRSGFLLEYAVRYRNNATCGPCTTADTLTEPELDAFGWPPDPALDLENTASWDQPPGGAHLSRLLVRYDPEDIAADLHLVRSGRTEPIGPVFFEPNPGLEALFPVCGEGFVEDPRTCEEHGLGAPGPAAVACATPSGSYATTALAALLFAVRRRRWA